MTAGCCAKVGSGVDHPQRLHQSHDSVQAAEVRLLQRGQHRQTRLPGRIVPGLLINLGTDFSGQQRAVGL